MTEQISQYEIVRSYAASWARATLRRAERYRAASQLAENRSWQYHQGEDWHLQWSDVAQALEDSWTEGHLFLVAGQRLDLWARRLAAERQQQVPDEDMLLNELRDALEHLAEVLFEGAEPVAGPARKRRTGAVSQPPRTPGASSTTTAGELLALGLLNVDRLEATTRRVAAEIEAEIQAPSSPPLPRPVHDRRATREVKRLGPSGHSLAMQHHRSGHSSRRCSQELPSAPRAGRVPR